MTAFTLNAVVEADLQSFDGQKAFHHRASYLFPLALASVFIEEDIMDLSISHFTGAMYILHNELGITVVNLGHCAIHEQLRDTYEGLGAIKVYGDYLFVLHRGFIRWLNPSIQLLSQWIHGDLIMTKYLLL